MELCNEVFVFDVVMGIILIFWDLKFVFYVSLGVFLFKA